MPSLSMSVLDKTRISPSASSLRSLWALMVQKRSENWRGVPARAVCARGAPSAASPRECGSGMRAMPGAGLSEQLLVPTATHGALRSRRETPNAELAATLHAASFCSIIATTAGWALARSASHGWSAVVRDGAAADGNVMRRHRTHPRARRARGDGATIGRITFLRTRELPRGRPVKAKERHDE